MSTTMKNAILGVVAVLLVAVAIWQFTRTGGTPPELRDASIMLIDENTLAKYPMNAADFNQLARDHGIRTPIPGAMTRSYWNAETQSHTLFRARKNDDGKWVIPAASDGEPRGPVD